MMSSPEQRATVAGRITHVTRRRLVEGFAAMPRTHWSGNLEEPEFLARLYPPEKMPSTDRRYDTAERDIFQHRVDNPFDWPDDWIFTDERFGLADNGEALLAFLVEMLHPEVRTDVNEVEQLWAFLNSVLIHDGYEIVQVDAVSGAPAPLGAAAGARRPAYRSRLVVQEPHLRRGRPQAGVGTDRRGEQHHRDQQERRVLPRLRPRRGPQRVELAATGHLVDRHPRRARVPAGSCTCAFSDRWTATASPRIHPARSGRCSAPTANCSANTALTCRH